MVVAHTRDSSIRHISTSGEEAAPPTPATAYPSRKDCLGLRVFSQSGRPRTDLSPFQLLGPKFHSLFVLPLWPLVEAKPLLTPSATRALGLTACPEHQLKDIQPSFRVDDICHGGWPLTSLLLGSVG